MDPVGRPGRLLRRLYGAALAGVEPEAAVRRALAGRDVRRALADRDRIGVFAVGKAAAGMARGAMRALTVRSALVILPRGSPARRLPGATVLRAAHPEPDASSVRAARRALREFAGFSARDAIVCLISGGASSLMELPRPGLSLARLRSRVRALAEAGAPIAELNRVRTALSAVQGRRAGTRDARAAHHARDVRRSGRSGEPGRLRADRARAAGRSRADRGVQPRRALVGGARGAEARLRAVIAARRLSGEAFDAGERLARRAKRLRAGTVWLEGGETVVRLGSARSRGGRSLELALSAALALEDVDAGDVALLAAGSDGRDGSSTAAGAFADGATIARARRLGLDPRRALHRHATHAFFAQLGDLCFTGPTGTNVGDWVFLLREPRRR